MSISAEATFGELSAEIDRRTSDRDFMAVLAGRNRIRERTEAQDEKLVKVRQAASRVGGSLVDLREATLASRAIHEELASYQTILDSYRGVTADLAQRAAELRQSEEKANGTFLEFTGPSLGSLVDRGSFPSGSPEWHAARDAGIGGSDVSKVIKDDPVYGARDYREVLLRKLGLGYEPDESERDDVLTAAGRGNAWEDYIRYVYADRHPEVQVAFCKSSWSADGEFSYRHANFDGLILDNSGKPVGVLEIKTGTDSSRWGLPSDGIWGAPVAYRRQVIWYAMLAGLEFGVLVALLDDHDWREYEFRMDDPRIISEVEEIKRATSEFWSLVTEKRAELAEGINTVSSRRKGFGKTVNMKRIAAQLASYSGEDEEDVYTRVRESFKNMPKSDGAWSKPQIQNLLTSLYAQHDPRTRVGRLVGIDIETNHAAVKKGRILETGIVELKNDGTTETLFHSVHGMPELARNGLGVGDSSIHRINDEMLAESPPFESAKTAETILELLKNSTMVAHNASFEDMFLTVNLPGYAEAREAGLIRLLDTRALATYFMLDSDDSSLSSFAEDNGVPYVGAHAALADTVMMMKALWRFQTTLHAKGRFVPARTTKRNRDMAERDIER